MREVVQGAILLASTVAFGAMMGQVARGGLRVDEYTDEQMGADEFREWVAAVLAFSLTGLSIHAFGSWVTHYSRTGEALDVEQIVQQYE